MNKDNVLLKYLKPIYFFLAFAIAISSMVFILPLESYLLLKAKGYESGFADKYYYATPIQSITSIYKSHLENIDAFNKVYPKGTFADTDLNLPSMNIRLVFGDPDILKDLYDTEEYISLYSKNKDMGSIDIKGQSISPIFKEDLPSFSASDSQLVILENDLDKLEGVVKSLNDMFDKEGLAESWINGCHFRAGDGVKLKEIIDYSSDNLSAAIRTSYGQGEKTLSFYMKNILPITISSLLLSAITLSIINQRDTLVFIRKSSIQSSMGVSKKRLIKEVLVKNIYIFALSFITNLILIFLLTEIDLLKIFLALIYNLAVLFIVSIFSIWMLERSNITDNFKVE